MLDKVIETVAYLIILIVATLIMRVLASINKKYKTQISLDIENIVDRACSTAVHTVEEQSEKQKDTEKMSSKQKRDLAVGMVTRTLMLRGIKMPIDLIMGKIDAAVNRILH